jgi:hypothetical protein
MMYHQKMVASIKANGRILRESNETVYIPFSSEYSILLKNLNTVRAVVNVFIDGDNVVPGGLILGVGQEIDLERSIKNNNLNEGNRFRFIERTGSVEKHRGVKLEDGLIRIEFQFEKVVPQQWGCILQDQWKNSNLQYPPGVRGGFSGWSGADRMIFASTSSMNIGGTMRGVDHSKGEFVKASAASAINNYCFTNNIQSSVGEVHDGMATMDWMPANDVGVTVPGSKSEQKFQTAYMGAMETEKHTIVLKLLGETPDNRPVERPVTVKAKPKCVTCGKQNRAHAKYCTECGTALEIFA